LINGKQHTFHFNSPDEMFKIIEEIKSGKFLKEAQFCLRLTSI